MDDDDNKIVKPIPSTVGEMIEFLKQFPKDYALDLYGVEPNIYGGSDWENSLYHMAYHTLYHAKCVEITLK